MILRALGRSGYFFWSFPWAAAVVDLLGVMQKKKAFFVCFFLVIFYHVWFLDDFRLHFGLERNKIRSWNQSHLRDASWRRTTEKNKRILASCSGLTCQSVQSLAAMGFERCVFSTPGSWYQTPWVLNDLTLWDQIIQIHVFVCLFSDVLFHWCYNIFI